MRFDIQSSLSEIQEFCANNEEYEEDDFEQLMSPRSKPSKHEEEEEKNEIYDVQNA